MHTQDLRAPVAPAPAAAWLTLALTGPFAHCTAPCARPVCTTLGNIHPRTCLSCSSSCSAAAPSACALLVAPRSTPSRSCSCDIWGVATGTGQGGCKELLLKGRRGVPTVPSRAQSHSLRVGGHIMPAAALPTVQLGHLDMDAQGFGSLSELSKSHPPTARHVAPTHLAARLLQHPDGYHAAEGVEGVQLQVAHHLACHALHNLHGSMCVYVY